MFANKHKSRSIAWKKSRTHRKNATKSYAGLTEMPKLREVGYIKITKTRNKYDPNYRAVILVFDKPITKLGEFDVAQWNYAYKLEDDHGIQIETIQETKRLSGSPSIFLRAIHKVEPKRKLFTYDMTFYLKSEISRAELEHTLVHWFSDEDAKTLVWTSRIPRTSTKRIPITEEMFNGIIQKIKKKESA
jgi:hypothetical protein